MLARCCRLKTDGDARDGDGPEWGLGVAEAPWDIGEGAAERGGAMEGGAGGGRESAKGDECDATCSIQREPVTTGSVLAHNY